VAERSARTEIEQRAILNKKMQRKLKEQKEEEYRNLASTAYQQATAAAAAAADRDATRETEEYSAGGAAAAGGEGQPGKGTLGGLAGYDSAGSDEEGREAREALRRDRQRDLKRELRMEAKKQEKGTSVAYREQERDVSERIALGQAAPVNKESMFDARLFNQDAGLSSGFGADDSYDVYSKVTKKRLTQQQQCSGNGRRSGHVARAADTFSFPVLRVCVCVF
jgi:SNW domain-containing protein 1